LPFTCIFLFILYAFLLSDTVIPHVLICTTLLIIWYCPWLVSRYCQSLFLVGRFYLLVSTSSFSFLQVWNSDEHEDLQVLVIISRPPVKMWAYLTLTLCFIQLHMLTDSCIKTTSEFRVSWVKCDAYVCFEPCREYSLCFHIVEANTMLPYS
jgi:hypothetical protein